MTFFSRSLSVCNTESNCSCSKIKLAASTGTTASESSMKSPRCESASSPMGVSRLTGSWETLRISRTFSGENSISRPISSGVGSRPRSCSSCRLIRDRPRNRLPNPPGRIRGELETLGVVELLHRADQSEVSLLDQVQQQHAPADVPSGDGDDQT